MTKHECYECGSQLKENEMVSTANGLVCQSCLDEHYFKCDHCDEWHHRSNMTAVTTSVFVEEYWCGNCVIQYAYYCERCGEYSTFPTTRVSTGSWSRNALCENCLDDLGYHECTECGAFTDDGDWDDDDDYYCQSCMDCNSILPYSRTCLPFLGDNEHLHMGVELEVDDGDNKQSVATMLQGILTSAEHKHDGSLSSSGFEIASAPATLEYHTNKMGWEEAMKCLLQHGFRSHNTTTCGFHVHVDRDYFHFDQEKVEEAFAMLFSNNLEWIKPFSRRRNYGYCLCDERDHPKTTPKEAKETGSKAKPDKFRRYLAINYGNHNTIEFRIFRGTLKYQTFLATLQFVEMFCDFVKSYDMEKLAGVHLQDFINKANKMGYTQFVTYVGERHLS